MAIFIGRLTSRSPAKYENSLCWCSSVSAPRDGQHRHTHTSSFILIPLTVRFAKLSLSRYSSECWLVTRAMTMPTKAASWRWKTPGNAATCITAFLYYLFAINMRLGINLSRRITLDNTNRGYSRRKPIAARDRPRGAYNSPRESTRSPSPTRSFRSLFAFPQCLDRAEVQIRLACARRRDGIPPRQRPSACFLYTLFISGQYKWV